MMVSQIFERIVRSSTMFVWTTVWSVHRPTRWSIPRARTFFTKPKPDKNDLLKDWDVVQIAFSGLLPEEFKNEYLFRYFYFSSNSCQSSKNITMNCPLGNFICTKDDQFIDTNQTLDFFEAKSFCSDQSYELSKSGSIL